MFVTVVKSAALAILATGSVSAADDPFIGKWKINMDKSIVAGQRVKVDELDANKYQFDTGAVAEVIVADGTDQPMEFGGTASLQKTGENTWKMINKRGQRVLSESDWSISPDGKTLTIHSTGRRLDGTKFDDQAVFTHIGGSGILGIWESNGKKLSSPPVWEIQAYQDDGLSFVYPSNKDSLSLKFDGEDYAEQGPEAPRGVTTSGERPNANTIQLTDKHDGNILDIVEWRVSTDAKTLTMTVHNMGQQKPLVFVYDRQ